MQVEPTKRQTRLGGVNPWDLRPIGKLLRDELLKSKWFRKLHEIEDEIALRRLFIQKCRDALNQDAELRATEESGFYLKTDHAVLYTKWVVFLDEDDLLDRPESGYTLEEATYPREAAEEMRTLLYTHDLPVVCYVGHNVEVPNPVKKTKKNEAEWTEWIEVGHCWIGVLWRVGTEPDQLVCKDSLSNQLIKGVEATVSEYLHIMASVLSLPEICLVPATSADLSASTDCYGTAFVALAAVLDGYSTEFNYQNPHSCEMVEEECDELNELALAVTDEDSEKNAEGTDHENKPNDDSPESVVATDNEPVPSTSKSMVMEELAKSRMKKLPVRENKGNESDSEESTDDEPIPGTSTSMILKKIVKIRLERLPVLEDMKNVKEDESGMPRLKKMVSRSVHVAPELDRCVDDGRSAEEVEDERADLMMDEDEREMMELLELLNVDSSTTERSGVLKGMQSYSSDEECLTEAGEDIDWDANDFVSESPPLEDKVDLNFLQALTILRSQKVGATFPTWDESMLNEWPERNLDLFSMSSIPMPEVPMGINLSEFQGILNQIKEEDMEIDPVSIWSDWSEIVVPDPILPGPSASASARYGPDLTFQGPSTSSDTRYGLPLVPLPTGIVKREVPQKGRKRGAGLTCNHPMCPRKRHPLRDSHQLQQHFHQFHLMTAGVKREDVDFLCTSLLPNGLSCQELLAPISVAAHLNKKHTNLSPAEKSKINRKALAKKIDFSPFQGIWWF